MKRSLGGTETRVRGNPQTLGWSVQGVALLEEIANHVRRRDLREALLDTPPAPGPDTAEPVEGATSAGPGPGAS